MKFDLSVEVPANRNKCSNTNVCLSVCICGKIKNSGQCGH